MSPLSISCLFVFEDTKYLLPNLYIEQCYGEFFIEKRNKPALNSYLIINMLFRLKRPHVIAYYTLLQAKFLRTLNLNKSLNLRQKFVTSVYFCAMPQNNTQANWLTIHQSYL
ncbi:hypothetical protein KUL10_07460 [Glaciecola sp. KUL10]|nr:hypothetical protein KUL10_07460 [Glaciecola sp. KUL10]